MLTGFGSDCQMTFCWASKRSQMKSIAQRYAHWNWALLDQALVSGSNFLAGILLVRYLGFEEYGRFVLVWMLIQFFASIQNALVVSPMLSIAPKISIYERSSYYSTTLIMQGGLIILIAVVGVVYFLIPREFRPTSLPEDSILPTALCLGSVQIQDYMRRRLFAQMASRRAFFLDMVAYGAQLPLILIVLRASPSFENALFVTAGAMASSSLLGCRWLKISIVSKGNIAKTAARHWRSSKWLLGAAVLQWMSGNYFMVVAGLVLGPATVGAIRAAQNLLGLTHILFQGLENIVPGEASHRYQDGGSKALFRYIAKIAFLLLTGTALVAAPVVILAEPLLRLVYGTFDQSSADAIIWFVPIYLLVAIALPLRAALRTLEHTSALFIAYVISTAFALVVAEYFVRQYSVGGVMAGMLVVQIITTSVLTISLLLELCAKWKSNV